MPAAGQDWTGHKNIRVFTAMPGDVAAHRLDELLPGAVLPEKWGGVATATALDPRLTDVVEQVQKESSITRLYTEWTEITTISGWVTDFWSRYETRSSGSRIGTLQRFQGERTAIILDSQVGPLAPHYNVALGADHIFPGATGALAAHLYGYRLAPMAERPLCSRVTLLYTEPTIIQALEPGRALLMVKVSGRKKALSHEPSGSKRVIDGPDDDLGNIKWKLVSGDNIVLEPEAHVIIRTASTDANVPNVFRMIGKVNSNRFSHIGNAPAGTMQFWGVSISGALINRKYWGHDYEFEYRPLKDGKTAFGGGIKSQKFKKFPMTVSVMTDDDPPVADGTKEATVVNWWPQGEPQSRTVAPGSENFSDLDGKLGWM